MSSVAADPSVAVVVLNWNGVQDTLRCIDSLERQTYPNFCILVVDNGSTDGSLPALRALGDRITLIESDANLGYTGGNNLAIREVLKGDADYIWLFNNDAVAKPDALALLVAAGEADPEVGLASPFLRDPDGLTADEFCGGKFDPEFLTFDTTNRPEIYEKWASTLPERIWLYGTALLVRRVAIEKMGLLDEKFFAYLEDNEISLRSAKLGFKNVVVIDSIVFHGFHNESASPYYFYYMARNMILLLRKHGKFPKILKSIVWVINQQSRKLSNLHHYARAQRAIYAGVWDGLRGVGGQYHPRRSKETLGQIVFVISKRLLKLL